ncbi:MAG TPA: hypothetical protein PLX23_02515 [Candidatus Hydrogenedens sp.]|nr:hypothetical protein [Candidatus Hydrogenedens sp.]
MNQLIKNNRLILSSLLIIVSIGFILFGIIGVISGKTGKAEKLQQETSTSSQQLNNLPVLNSSSQETQIGNKAPTDLKNPDQLIEYYRTQLQQNPQAPETPAYLSAIGNLYKQRKMDCANAIPYYERIIIDYPDWEGVRSIYPELAMCYESVNDYRGKIWIHNEIMRRFPPDSQEYIYAKNALGL